MQPKHWEEKMLEQAIEYKRQILAHLHTQWKSKRNLDAIARHDAELLELEARLELLVSQPNA